MIQLLLLDSLFRRFKAPSGDCTIAREFIIGNFLMPSQTDLIYFSALADLKQVLIRSNFSRSIKYLLGKSQITMTVKDYSKEIGNCLQRIEVDD